MALAPPSFRYEHLLCPLQYDSKIYDFGSSPPPKLFENRRSRVLNNAHTPGHVAPELDRGRNSLGDLLLGDLLLGDLLGDYLGI